MVRLTDFMNAFDSKSFISLGFFRRETKAGRGKPNGSPQQETFLTSKQDTEV
jgi:hypothetical protein